MTALHATQQNLGLLMNRVSSDMLRYGSNFLFLSNMNWDTMCLAERASEQAAINAGHVENQRSIPILFNL